MGRWNKGCNEQEWNGYDPSQKLGKGPCWVKSSMQTLYTDRQKKI
jgi:hypothetical protein